MRNFLLVLAVLVAGSAVYAQTCGIRRISSPLYYYNGGQYHKYPGHGNHGQLYNYHNGYYYPYDYKETIILVPKAIQVEVHRDHYFSIDGAAQQSLLADAIVGRLLRLQQEGKLPTSKGTGRLPTGPPAKPSPTGDGGGGDAQELKAGEYQNVETVKAVENSCAKCHGPNSRYTKLLTVDGKLADLQAGKVWECFGLVNSGEMPKGGKTLDDAKVKLFYEWAKNARR